MKSNSKLLLVLFIALLAINIHLDNLVSGIIPGSSKTDQSATILLTSLAYADIIQPQDKVMHIVHCSCGGGCYSYGFSCALPGNDCYTSNGCFCGDCNPY